MANASVIKVVRAALIDNNDRNIAYSFIQDLLGVSRTVAKRLVFAFYYYADEEYMQQIINGEVE